VDVAGVYLEAFDRIPGLVRGALDGLSNAELVARPDDEANSVAWLIWHLTRIEDDHVADVAGDEQVWTSEDWFTRFSLPFDPGDTGFGHSRAEVAAVNSGGELLLGYQEAVHQRVRQYLAKLNEGDLDRVIDSRWDPPVTLGVRLVSVIGDALEHVGQAAYVRGLLLRQREGR
jgi:hypothetical protein